jgi:diguanylate cyclase (GGDEF)-like protein
MRDEDKTKEQLLEELRASRDQISELKRINVENAQVQQTLAGNLERFKIIYQAITSGVIVQNVEGVVVHANDLVCKLLGLTLDQIRGHMPIDPRWYSIREDGSPFPREEHPIMVTLRTGKAVHNVVIGVFSSESEDLVPKGDPASREGLTQTRKPRWLLVNSEPILDPETGHLKEAAATFIDITERKQSEETINRLAYYDILTDLPNQVLFNDRLTLALAHAKRNQKKLAVLVLDLDGFKTINDTLGHSMGDRLLQGVAYRLRSCLREGDVAARLGGDEFLLLLQEITQEADAAQTVEKIQEAFRPSFHFNNHELHITASIGIAFYPQDGEDVQTLLRNADTALHRAKERGRNSYQLHTTTMNAKAFERLLLEHGLRRALDRQELVLHYQPQVSLITGKIVGMEALVRWLHPDWGLLPPMRFIPLAEETGLILPLGEWCLRAACAQNKTWQNEGFPPIRVSVNISARFFKQKSLTDLIAKVLKETRLESQYLELELTESIVMENAETTIKTLRELKNMGVYLSIDDFGTGYSSLSYLKRFPIDALKIDRSFVHDITTNPDDAAIATAIIAMAHSLKLKVIAEGVEKEDQLPFLYTHQCDEMQGFYFSRPVPVNDFVTMLKEGKNLNITR